MYIPDDYAENRLDVLHSLITEYPFGVLFTHGSNGLDANHLPFELQKMKVSLAFYMHMCLELILSGITLKWR